MLLMGCLAVLTLFSCVGCGELKGKFYSLEQAYEQGFIDEEDVKHILYFSFGEVLDENKDEIEFTPSVSLKATNQRTEELLKKALYKQYPSGFRDSIRKKGEKYVLKSFQAKCHGEYKGYYLVTFTSPFWLFTTDIRFRGAAGYYYFDDDLVFRIFAPKQ